jgi:hypothetical protein
VDAVLVDALRVARDAPREAAADVRVVRPGQGETHERRVDERRYRYVHVGLSRWRAASAGHGRAPVLRPGGSLKCEHEVDLLTEHRVVGGGTDQVQRNAFGERLLGLPARFDKDVPFRELPK